MNHRNSSNSADFLHCHCCHRPYSNDILPVNLLNSVCCKSCVRDLVKHPDGKIKCPRDAEKYPVNTAFLQILGLPSPGFSLADHLNDANEKEVARNIEKILLTLSDFFKITFSDGPVEVVNDTLSKFVQKRIIGILSAPILLPDGRHYVVKCSRNLVERIVTELVLSRQTSAHISSALWSAVRARGCQFLGPAMQAEVLRLVLQALSEGELIARKTLVLFIVEAMAEGFPQVSKTCVGHVVQLLYRASCFNVIKRDGESSLMQLKDEFRQYAALRREHDSQIVQIALEAGLRISPDQWSQLLYGDASHRQQMDLIVEQLTEPHSLTQNELQALKQILEENADDEKETDLVLNGMSDVLKSELKERFDLYDVLGILRNVEAIVNKYAQITRAKNFDPKGIRKTDLKVVAPVNGQRMYKTRFCRDVMVGRPCPRGDRCTYAHSSTEIRGNSGQGMPMETPLMPHQFTSVDVLTHQFNEVQLDAQQNIPQQLAPQDMMDQGLVMDGGFHPANPNNNGPPVVVPVVMHHQDMQSGLVQPSLTHALMIPNNDPNSGGTLLLPSDSSNPVPQQMPVQLTPMMPNDVGMVPLLSNTVLVPTQPMNPPMVTQPVPQGMQMAGGTPVPPTLQAPLAGQMPVQLNGPVPVGAQVPVGPPGHPMPQTVAPTAMMFNQNTFWYSEHFLPRSEHKSSSGQQFGSGHVHRPAESALRFPDSIWEMHDDQMLLARRNEIVSCLNKMMRDDVMTTEDDDDSRSHVSYTVANSVLFDEFDMIPNTKLELPPLPSLNTLPISFADAGIVPPPVFPAGTPRDLCQPGSTGSDSKSRLDSMSSADSQFNNEFNSPKKISTSSIPTSLFGTSPQNVLNMVKTMCPTTMFTQKSTAPATVQADCSVMNVKDMFEKPLVISTIQHSNLSPQASFEMVDPINMVDHVPQVIRPLSLKSDPQHIVSATLDRILNVKERIYDVDKIGGSGSAVEKAQLKLELNIVNRQINSLDTPTQQSCLLKELEAVDKQIEDMNVVA
ncbi:unnamed protein product [Bursaphelenchus xylophilus]|uniref:RING-type E3 ubiquitin transferase n=1 Tax=Bursaphelenchus xylophilus TaxID=6326 RepID=A0A1I7SQY8_BURXY|nr:unnamed protein product [Bursaphelenchus xylophilus]CAG9110577.1 unnamed protein product [Bursaphelenchus xylophilus]